MNEYILLRPFRVPRCGCLGIAPVPAKLDLNRPRSKWPSRNPKERLGVFANETTSRRFPGCGSVLCLASVPSFSQTVPNWAPNTAYAVGALVMYQNVEYKCIQAHTSQVGWEPPNVPALWQPVSGSPTPTPTPPPTATPTPTPQPT